MMTEHDTPASRGIDAQLEAARPRPASRSGDPVAAFLLIAIGALIGSGATVAVVMLWVMP